MRSDIEELTDSDATSAGFFSSCLAAPAGSCALARPQTTAAELEQKVITLLDTLKYSPIVAGPAEATSYIDYGTLKSAILLSLYSPLAYWPALAAGIQGLLNNNATAFLEFVAAISSPSAPNLLESEAGIRCGDNSFRAKSLKEVQPLIDELYAKSWVEGDNEGILALTCSSWRLRAKEVYSGGFHDIRTKNPLLFVGNTFDPLTPLASAQNASAAFVGSSVLQNDGYGVCFSFRFLLLSTFPLNVHLCGILD